MDKEHMIILEKGKKTLFDLFFSRFTIIAFLLIIQLTLIFFIFEFFYHQVLFWFGGSILFSLFILMKMLDKPSNPSIQLTWAIIILFFPIVGGLLYIYIQSDVGYKIVRNHLGHIDSITKDMLGKNDLDEFNKTNPSDSQLATYLYNYGGFPVYSSCDVKYFKLGEEMFDDMIKTMSQAKKYIYLEFFIIEEGLMLGKILKVLKEKVDQGVEVRFMYDGTCAFNKVSFNYHEKLKKLGIKCKVYAPIQPIITTLYNNRDHRKILIIDGKYAYTGGVNLADEYINHTHPFGHWKDTAVRVEGKAVESFLMMFNKMWFSDLNVTASHFEYKMSNNLRIDNGYVIPYGDQPFDNENVGEMVYLDLINKAQDHIYISSPYFIVDTEIITALSFASKRGVDVKIVLPGIADKKSANYLAKSSYKQLLDAGIEVYEYKNGFNHAKMFEVDGTKATVGTVNLDYRSLYLHFECGLLMFYTSCIQEIHQDMLDMISKSEKITYSHIRKYKFKQKAITRLLKIFAPLM